jgi:hypothetical protein
MVVHRIIPEEIARQAGIYDFRTAALCRRCTDEIETWYRSRVHNVRYQDSSKRFEFRAPAELVREYAAEYAAFTAYKKRGRAES